MVAAGDAKREEHEEIFSLCFFPPRLNSTVRGGAREGIKAGGAERAGPKRRRVRVGGGRGCLRGCWLAAPRGCRAVVFVGKGVGGGRRT